MEARFVYFSCKSLSRCEDMLEHLFATGEVCEGEFPKIERRGSRWCITLPM
jgi:hypothetical protein